MNSDLKMMKIVKQMLFENEFKDNFNKFDENQVLTVFSSDGKKYKFYIIDKDANKITLSSNVSNQGKGGNKFILNKNALYGNMLTAFDSSNNEKKIDIERIIVYDNATGSSFEINIDSKELEKAKEKNEATTRVDEFNNILKKLDVGDTLVITNRSLSDGDDEIVNDLYLKVDYIKDFYRCRLESVEGNVDGELSIKSQNINNLGGAYIFIGGNLGVFRVENNEVVINLGLKSGATSKAMPLTGVIDVQNNSIEGDIDYDDDDKKISKDKLQQKLMKDKTFQSMLNKKPSLMDTLRGASPKGLMQLKNLVQKYNTKNSYLTVGKYVKFKLTSEDIIANPSKKILNRRDKYYEAKVTAENTLQNGDIGKGHWEFKLKKEIADNLYETQVSYCKPDRSCDIMQRDATIKILTNE